MIAVRDGVDSLPSAVASATTILDPPATPPLSVQAHSTEIDLTWTDVATETGYRIERSDDGGTGWATVGTAGQDVTSFTDAGLTPGTGYAYRVIALNAGGESVPSTPAFTTTNRRRRGNAGRTLCELISLEGRAFGTTGLGGPRRRLGNLVHLRRPTHRGGRRPSRGPGGPGRRHPGHGLLADVRAGRGGAGPRVGRSSRRRDRRHQDLVVLGRRGPRAVRGAAGLLRWPCRSAAGAQPGRLARASHLDGGRT